MQQIKIDLVSDIACPWCAIGFARLEKALKSLPDINATIEWHAFELNPDKNMSKEPILRGLSK